MGQVKDGADVRVRQAVIGALTLAACGTSTPSPGSNSAKLTVLAAASLIKVFPQVGVLFTRAHPGVAFNFSFGGTDQVVLG